MRYARLVLAVAALALTATGCDALDSASGAESEEQPSSSAEETKVPDSDDSAPSPTGEAADAGGLCEYLEFGPLADATGQPFSVATSGGDSEVTSCVVMTTEGSFPDVTVTKAKTSANAKAYKAKIPPDGAEEIDDLGKAAYSAVRDEVEKGGPVVEVGWLTKGNMYSVRYTTVSGTDKDEASATVDGLVEASRAFYDAVKKD